MRSFLVLIAFAACGHDATPPPKPPGPKPIAPDAPAALDATKIACEHAVRCATIGKSQLAECETTKRLTLVLGSNDLLGLHPALSQTCLATLAAAGCRDNPRCDEIPQTTPPGAACKFFEECADGFCTARAGCTGTCVANSPIGGSCGPNQLCTDRAFCDSNGTCRARGKVGEKCGGHWQWCEDGLFCAGYRPPNESTHDMSPEVQGTCRAPLDVGESCLVEGEHCKTGLYCAWGDPDPACRAPLAAGAACRWLDACADGLACTGLVLKGVAPNHRHFAVAKPGACTPVLDIGSACEPSAYITGCPASQRCDRTTKKCRSQGHAGDPCESSWITTPHPDDVPLDNEGCFSGHYCDVATRTCKTNIPLGGACTPQTFGVEDEPCFLAKCDAKTHRCALSSEQCPSGK